MSSTESQQRGWGDCTLQDCPIEWSIFKYQPSLPANALFIAIFGISMLVHLYQGYRWKQWTFASLVALGCASEMIGYGGRIIMHDDPWSFSGFMLQIICITFAPVFMTAAIYVTLYKSIMRLSPSSAQFKPSLYYQIFIPLDVLCLVIQSVAGALSSQSDGSSKIGVNLGLAGLSLQVAVIFAFIALSVQYAFRYNRDIKSGKVSSDGLDGKFKFFATFVSLALLVIFIRCVFRIYELSEGYSGAAFHEQGVFIGLESIMIILATIFLDIGHPGLVFDPRRTGSASSSSAAGKNETYSSSGDEGRGNSVV